MSHGSIFSLCTGAGHNTHCFNFSIDQVTFSERTISCGRLHSWGWYCLIWICKSLYVQMIMDFTLKSTSRISLKVSHNSKNGFPMWTMKYNHILTHNTYCKVHIWLGDSEVVQLRNQRTCLFDAASQIWFFQDIFNISWSLVSYYLFIYVVIEFKLVNKS